jgi:hypothetical protein
VAVCQSVRARQQNRVRSIVSREYDLSLGCPHTGGHLRWCSLPTGRPRVFTLPSFCALPFSAGINPVGVGPQITRKSAEWGGRKRLCACVNGFRRQPASCRAGNFSVRQLSTSIVNPPGAVK